MLSTHLCTYTRKRTIMENKITDVAELTGYFTEWGPIYDKLKERLNFHYTEFDINYLTKWIRQAPDLFPSFMLEGRYTPVADWLNDKWDIYETKEVIETNKP